MNGSESQLSTIVFSDMTDDYSLPPDLVLLAEEQSWEIQKSLEQITGGYLTYRQITAIRFDTKGGPLEISASEVARFLGQLRPMALDSTEPRPARPKIVSLAGGVGGKLTEFIELFFVEIRDIILQRTKTAICTAERRRCGACSLADYPRRGIGNARRWCGDSDSAGCSDSHQRCVLQNDRTGGKSGIGDCESHETEVST
jgi:hypothetical protein